MVRILTLQSTSDHQIAFSQAAFHGQRLSSSADPERKAKEVGYSEECVLLIFANLNHSPRLAVLALPGSPGRSETWMIFAWSDSDSARAPLVAYG